MCLKNGYIRKMGEPWSLLPSFCHAQPCLKIPIEYLIENPYLKSLRLQKKLDPLARMQWALKVGVSENKLPLFGKRIFFKRVYIIKIWNPWSLIPRFCYAQQCLKIPIEYLIENLLDFNGIKLLMQVVLKNTLYLTEFMNNLFIINL